MMLAFLWDNDLNHFSFASHISDMTRYLTLFFFILAPWLLYADDFNDLKSLTKNANKILTVEEAFPFTISTSPTNSSISVQFNTQPGHYLTNLNLNFLHQAIQISNLIFPKVKKRKMSFLANRLFMTSRWYYKLI